jgi:PAS domain S-box-containing protein
MLGEKEMPVAEITPTLSVLKGLSLGQSFPLKLPLMVLGRDPTCDIVLALQTISRQHARLWREPDGVYLEDLQSLNGTLVNGKRIEGRRRLRDGDRIEIHNVLLGFFERPGPVPPGGQDEFAETWERSPAEVPAIVSTVDVLSPDSAWLKVDPESKLRAMLEIIRNAGASLDIDEVLSKIIESLLRIFPQAKCGCALLPGGSEGQFVPHGVKFRGREPRLTLTLWDTQLASRVMAEGKAILTTHGDSEVAAQERVESVLDLHLRSVMCAPLVAPSCDALGVIKLESEDAQHAFTQADLEVLGSIAMLVGQFVLFAQRHEHCRSEAQREQEHRATERERRLLRAVLEILPVGVFIADQQGRLMEANPASQAIWGQAPLIDSPRHYSEHYKAWWPTTGERVESDQWAVARALERGEVSIGEELLIESNEGERRTILNYAVPIRGDGEQITGAVAVNVDITRQKQAEAALKEADRRKDEFLAMLAHELRNPLAPVRNALALVKADAAEPSTIPWAFEMIERQVDHLVRLVDDLLDVSRAMQGKIKLRKVPVELSKIVAHAVETARPVIDGQSHCLSVSLPAEPIWLEADEIRLAQVIGNLLDNASKYTDSAGHIALTATRHFNDVVLSVRDTGIGIPAEMLPRIFELFIQGEPSLDRSHGGLGIGLSLVQKLVEMHGGSVQGRSDGVGRGSEFVVRLPICAPPASVEAPPARPVERADCRVLVVDDNVDAATTLAMMFRLWKHEVEVAHDGAGAIEMARRFHPDLILLDIGLPGKNGFEVARHLRQDPEFRETLLVAVTGYGQDQDRQQSQEAGFDHHLVKPVEARYLKELLSHPKLSARPAEARAACAI